jgi:hypothetical protein
MSDESPIEEEYVPADVDPDNLIASLPDGVVLPVEADPADWVDQHRIVPDDLDEERG